MKTGKLAVAFNREFNSVKVFSICCARGEPIVIDNAIHPVNRRVALARAIRSVPSVFDLRMNDMIGINDGHFGPFSWRSAAAT